MYNNNPSFKISNNNVFNKKLKLLFYLFFIFFVLGIFQVYSQDFNRFSHEELLGNVSEQRQPAKLAPIIEKRYFQKQKPSEKKVKEPKVFEPTGHKPMGKKNKNDVGQLAQDKKKEKDKNLEKDDKQVKKIGSARLKPYNYKNPAAKQNNQNTQKKQKEPQTALEQKRQDSPPATKVSNLPSTWVETVTNDLNTQNAKTQLSPDDLAAQWRRPGINKTSNNKSPILPLLTSEKPFSRTQTDQKNKSNDASENKKNLMDSSQVTGNDNVKDSNIIRNDSNNENRKERTNENDPSQKNDAKKGQNFLAEDIYRNPESSDLLQKAPEQFPREEAMEAGLRKLGAIKSFYKMGAFQKVIDLTNGLNKTEAIFPEALFYRGLAQTMLSLPGAAILSYLEIARSFPSHSLADDALIEASRLYLRLNRPGQAVVLLSQVLRLYPQGDRVDDAYYYLGDIYATQMQYQDEARARYFWQRLLSEYNNTPGAKYSPYHTVAAQRLKSLQKEYTRKESF